MKSRIFAYPLLVTAILVFGTTGQAQDSTTVAEAEAIIEGEGLVPFPEAAVQIAFVRPGVDWAAYDSFYLTELRVTPEAINAKPTSMSGRRSLRESWVLPDRDVEGMKRLYADVTVRELTRGGQFEVVDEPREGTLVLVQSIVHIALSAPIPDSRYTAFGRGETYTEWGAALTISGLIADGETGRVLARFSDQRYPPRIWLPDTRQRLRGDAREIFRHWGSQFRKRLNEIRAGELVMP